MWEIFARLYAAMLTGVAAHWGYNALVYFTSVGRSVAAVAVERFSILTGLGVQVSRHVEFFYELVAKHVRLD